MKWFFGRSVRRRSGAAAILIVLVLLVVPNHRAQAGILEGLVGWEGDTHQQGYGFLGLGALVPAGEQLTFPVRLTGSYLYYNYDSTGTSISVKSPGISLLAGARVLGSRGSASALVGGEARREHRESATAPTRVATPVSFVVQADGDMVLARHWRAFLLGNYAGAAKYLFGRGAVQYQVSNLDWKQPTSLFVGAELVRQGNNDSDAAQGGVFLEWNFLPQRVSVGLHGGYKESWSPGQTHRSGGYIAMSAYRHF